MEIDNKEYKIFDKILYKSSVTGEAWTADLKRNVYLGHEKKEEKNGNIKSREFK